MRNPIYINRAAKELMSSFKVLGIHIFESLNYSILVRKTKRHLHFLQSLRKAQLCPRIQGDFYRCTIESMLTNGISRVAWQLLRIRP